MKFPSVTPSPRKIMNLIKSTFYIAVLSLFASSTFAGDIDNPMYKNWSAFKVGTWVKMKSETEASGMKTEMETTSKLVELTAAKAVVEVTTSMTTMGNKMDLPARKDEIPAKIPDATATTEKKPDVKQGTEDVDAGGKKVKAQWVEMDTNGTKSKVWTSTEVPGTMVKMNSETPGQSKTTMTLVGWGQ
jgi:hypothetical protein